MLQFSVSADASPMLAKISTLKKDRLPKAITDAANELGSIVNGALRSEILQRFDRPTLHTQRALDWRRATREKPLVRIWLKDDPNKGTAQDKYLSPQIAGGGRRHKRFERALIARGLMPSNLYAVPGRAAPVDSYGNVPGSFIVRMLSDLQAFGEQGYRANRKGVRRGARKQNYFFAAGKSAATAHLKPGIYWHLRDLILPVFLFTRAPGYSIRYPFYEIGSRVYNRYRDRIVAKHIERGLYANR